MRYLLLIVLLLSGCATTYTPAQRIEMRKQAEQAWQEEYEAIWQ
jgi:uncharacterized protein YceK